MIRPATDFDHLARWQSPSRLTPRQAASQVVANTKDQVTLGSPGAQAEGLPTRPHSPNPQAPIQETAAPAPVALAVKEPAFQLCRGVVQLRQAVRPEIWRASPSTVQAFQQDATLIGTLCGASLLAPLPLDRQQGQLSPEGWNQLADFQVLSRNLNLMGSQKFTVMEDPAQAGQWVLVNKSALCQALDRTDLGEFPLEDLEISGNLRSLLRSESPTREFAEEVGRLSQLPNARALVYLQQPQTMPPLHDSPDEVKSVGLISYVNSPDQWEKFQATLHEWDQNFAAFGHSGRVLRICDDSPPPYGDQLKAYAASFQSESHLQIEVLGREEKEQRRQQLIEKLLLTPRAQQLGVDRAQLDQMTRQMLGGLSEAGQWTSGPTQNRNLSMLLLQGQRAFQADHDMQPRVLTAAGECERQEFLEVHRPPPEIRARQLVLRDTDDTDHYADQGVMESLPVDLLAQMSQVPSDRIASPQFCGSDDPPISHLVSGSLREPANFSRSQERVAKERWFSGDSGTRRTASPMVLPASYDADKLLPFAPPIRDGDLMPGVLMEAFSGIRPRELQRAILHTETAGSKWGGEASLLSDSALSEAVTMIIQEHLVKGSPEESADAILASLQQPQAGEYEVKTKLADYQDLANRYTQNRRDRALALQELTLQLSQPEHSQPAAHTWREGCTPAQARLEVTAALQQCQSEANQMESIFPQKDSGLPFPQLGSLASQARDALSSFALALKLRQELLELVPT